MRRKLGPHWNESLGLVECPYAKRWRLELGFCSLRLHHWISNDDPRAYHDHPWWFITLVLRGGYRDVSPAGNDYLSIGSIRFRPARHTHTVYPYPGGAWTFLLCGPETNEWGFWTGISPGNSLVDGKFWKSYRYFHKFKHHPCA